MQDDLLFGGVSRFSDRPPQEAPSEPAAMTTTAEDSPHGPYGGLKPSQLEAFHRDGYLIVPNALPPTTVKALLDETHTLLEDFSLADHPMTKFSTGERSAHVGDDYFLDSGDKVRFFFEEDAFSSETGELTKPKARAINKIGHYLHALSPPFAALLDPVYNPDLLGAGTTGGSVEAGRKESHPAAAARSLGFKDPRVLQSMVICKQPEIGGAVPPHQDSTFLYTDPPSAVGFWYALEDATVENGCLSFLPGSHRWAPVKQRFVRDAEGKGTTFMDNQGPKFPNTEEYGERLQGEAKETDDYVMGEVKAGDLVLIHGNLLHKSEKNLSQKGRIIYTFHVIEGEGAKYDERNWLQPPADGFTKLFRD
ncbi:Phytanoyl-CoA dioxygenase domain-containing protein 1 [Apiospora rasikravindrae]|uniref:Phytanoyl-CoA dioxygenase domain-containing protein 1 n=1 Tax=Apiospora rasikravindrae TaxID=990691 RepID=A0ABR1U956_9PEZI